MSYKEWHTSHPFEAPRVEKSEKLSDEEITEARGLIAYYNKHHFTATQAINALRRKLRKLAAQPDAARVYWTETKKADTQATLSLGEEIGFTTYKVILSPSACRVCRKKTSDGERIFSDKEVAKTGYGQFVPFHPNCFCIAVPHVE